MKITRKEFLRTTASAAAFTAVSSSGIMAAACTQGTSAGKPKRGVSIYSYSDLIDICMTLEDCMKDIYDMEAPGLEILANGHIDNYPNPTDEWCENFKALCTKYNITPVEYGHWIDSRMHPGGQLQDVQTSYNMLLRDIKLANKLGFTIGRTKLGLETEDSWVPNWPEFIEMALPDAEEYNFTMCPEIHGPVLLKSKFVDDVVAFVDRTQTKYFGLNIDLSVFQNKPRPPRPGRETEQQQDLIYSEPEELEPLLPYVHCIHAKFYNMSDDMNETTIPYDQIIDVLVRNKWDGYLLSEYEGQRDTRAITSDQLRKHHIMMKRLLGEA